MYICIFKYEHDIYYIHVKKKKEKKKKNALVLHFIANLSYNLIKIKITFRTTLLNAHYIYKILHGTIKSINYIQEIIHWINTNKYHLRRD